MASSLRIATFNCNSIRKRMPIVLDWLHANRPDVLALQETKVVDKDFPLEPLQQAGYHVTFRGMKSYNGVATLSLEKPSDVVHGFEPGPDSEDFRLLQTTIRGVRIINSYVPQGFKIDSEKYKYKLGWFKRLRSYFDDCLRNKGEAIWLGDLNVAPENLDVHAPEKHRRHVCFHDDARREYKSTVEGRFVDVFRKLYPDKIQYTFWDFFSDSFSRNKGWRIDHILATSGLANKCKDVVVDLTPRKAESPSDHTIVMAEFL
jgi:exodeoxyribonuclease-3